MSTWLVVPAYNEAATLAEVVRTALVHVPHVVVVDDGSVDGTASTIAHLPVDLLVHAANQGKSASLVDGIAHALAHGAEIVMTMDGDGQHRAVDLPRLLRAAERNPGTIIIGARIRVEGPRPLLRRAANRLADFCVSWAAGQRVLDSQSGQRLYPAALFHTLGMATLPRDGFTLESEILVAGAVAGYRIAGVPIDAIYANAARASHYKPWIHSVAIARMLIARGLGAHRRLARLWNSVRRPAMMVGDRVAEAGNVEAAEATGGLRMSDLDAAALNAER